jgi:protein TonB
VDVLPRRGDPVKIIRGAGGFGVGSEQQEIVVGQAVFLPPTMFHRIGRMNKCDRFRLIKSRAGRCLVMNTITFDGGVKRRFVLPAAIVLSAYAALFLGFVSNPPATPPFLPQRIILVDPSPLPVVEETGSDAGKPVGGGPSQPHPLDIPDPISSKEPDMPGIPITPELPGPPVAFPGPWSPTSGPGIGIGPGGQVLSPEMLDRTPEAVRQQRPTYPWAARQTGESGEVVVTFVVDESGRVLNPRVVSSSDPIFEEPTLRAIEQWRFVHGTVHGVPVRFRMSVPVAFNLDR